MSRLLTVSEAAQLVRLSPDTLYKLAKTRRIPHIKLGSTIRFRESDLLTPQSVSTDDHASS